MDRDNLLTIALVLVFLLVWFGYTEFLPRFRRRHYSDLSDSCFANSTLFSQSDVPEEFIIHIRREIEKETGTKGKLRPEMTITEIGEISDVLFSGDLIDTIDDILIKAGAASLEEDTVLAEAIRELWKYSPDTTDL